MKVFYIATNSVKDPEWINTRLVRDYIEQRGGKCYTSEGMPLPPGDNDRTVVNLTDDVECVITMGGDGTMLHVARDIHETQIPMIGINIGTLGYLTELNMSTFKEGVDALIEDRYTIEERMMLYGKIFRGEELLFRDTALNEIVISRDSNPKMINLRNYVNGRLLNKISADGTIVATATGSTGYSLSAGGPIISPETEVFHLTPLAPHSLSNRSIVLPAKDDIVVELAPDKYGHVSTAMVSFDGDSLFPIRSGDRVEIRKSNKNTLFAKVYHTSFLDVLYKKMNPAWETEDSE